MVSFIKRILLGDAAFVDKVEPGQYPFLVTGCARSGTHFLTKFLQLNGLDIGHEVTAPLGTVGWLCASAQYREERQARFDKTAHLIRHPAQVLKSLQTMNPRAWNYIFQYKPECRHEDLVIAGARYWLEWNKMAAAQSILSVRLEDFTTNRDKTVRDLMIFFGQGLDQNLVEEAQTHGDSRKGRRDYGHAADLSHVQKNDPATYEGMKALAERFGYAMETD